jgi:hypothetical protein
VAVLDAHLSASLPPPSDPGRARDRDLIDCHHGLYEQLAAEYAAARQEGGKAA